MHAYADDILHCIPSRMKRERLFFEGLLVADEEVDSEEEYAEIMLGGHIVTCTVHAV